MWLESNLKLSSRANIENWKAIFLCRLLVDLEGKEQSCTSWLVF